jgi:hypothetical protein
MGAGSKPLAFSDAIFASPIKIHFSVYDLV